MLQGRAELEELQAIVKGKGLKIEHLAEELTALQLGSSELEELRAASKEKGANTEGWVPGDGYLKLGPSEEGWFFPASLGRAAFEALDQDDDGLVSAREFRADAAAYSCPRFWRTSLYDWAMPMGMVA